MNQIRAKARLELQIYSQLVTVKITKRVKKFLLQASQGLSKIFLNRSKLKHFQILEIIHTLIMMMIFRTDKDDLSKGKLRNVQILPWFSFGCQIMMTILIWKRTSIE